MTLRLYLLRHGQTAMSRANVFCGRGLDPELTPEGFAMAEAFADAHRHEPWTHIYSSPLKRAVTTAAPLAKRLGMDVELRDELAELDYGEWDGLTADEVARRWHDEHERWTADPAWNPPTGGETAIALAQRMTNVIEEITGAHIDGNVLVVSHKASIRVLLCALLGVDVGRFRYRFACPVGSASIVDFGAHGPLAVAVAERSHLSVTLRELEGT
ncbi:MAG: histidine phosphatase family protein [bacterium]